MIQLNVSSAYSLMNSTLRLDAYVAEMAQRGANVIALADDTMHGVPAFFRTCARHNASPLVGLRKTFVCDGLDIPVIVYAFKASELEQLNEMASMSESISDVRGLHTIILPDAWKVHDPIHRRRLYTRLTTFIPEDHLWIALPAPTHTDTHLLVEQLRQIGEEFGANTLPAPEVRYARESDFEAYRALRAIHDGRVLSHDDLSGKGLELPRPSELNAWYTDMELQRLNRFVSQLEPYVLPHVPEGESLPVIENAAERLGTLVETGLSELGAHGDAYSERARYELNVINEMGFAAYFLIVADIVRYARERGIEVGPGRGSAAGSLVSYALRITEVDPVANGLLFERFLNPERLSMPDIDLDFEDTRREEVVRYVLERFTREHSAQIGTLATFGAKAALRDVARALGMTLEEGTAASKQVKATLSELFESDTKQKWFSGSQKRKELLRIASQLEGLPRQSSIHAAGLVLSRHRLQRFVPLVPSETDWVTQYNMNDLESVGLLKIDLLGLKNLSRLKEMERWIRTQDPLFSFKTIPLDDYKTLRLLARGDTDGIFQFESSGMKQALRQVKPSTFEDIVATMSLYRPGPMQFIEVYAKRKHGLPYRLIHDALEPILRDTHGVLVYQEQVMRILRELGGYTYAEADLVRRAIAKKDVEVIEAERERFLRQASERYPLEAMKEVFSWVERFAGYGFNRSHAYAYSLISYRLAYVKARFERVFWLVTSEQTVELVRALRKARIPVYPPDVLHRTYVNTLEGPGVRLGLQAIQGIGKRDLERLTHIPDDVTTIEAMMTYMEWGKRDETKVMQMLASGAFDRMYQNDREKAFREFESIRQRANSALLQDELLALGLKRKPIRHINWAEAEREALGTWVQFSPFQELPEIAVNTVELNQCYEGGKHYAVVYVDDVRTFKTKKGETMGVLLVDDGVSFEEVVFFPRVYEPNVRSLYVGNVLLLEIHASERNGRTQLIVERVRPVHGQALFVKLPKERYPELEEVLRMEPGDVPVVCRFSDVTETKQLASHLNVRLSGESITELRRRFGTDAVVLKKIKAK